MYIPVEVFSRDALTQWQRLVLIPLELWGECIAPLTIATLQQAIPKT